ncbi:MAG: hypothetical protein HOV79_13825 [Hamadaea sp.]|nr:hypothetical protein [Hamadaea sp.]
MTKATRAGLIGVVVVALLGAFALYLAGRGGSRPFGLPIATGCSVRSGEREISVRLEQMANAATITAVGVSRKVPERAVVVALATAWQESKLENLSGGDRDSIGLFQQRPSQGWGTEEQISDPRYASRKFYTALLKVKNWQKMRVTDAAQKVQRSAYPEAYEKWADESEVMAAALLGKVSAAVSCTLPGDESDLEGQAAVAALSDTLRLDYGSGVKATADPAGKAVRVSAANGPTGWAYAHWLVSRAADHGVARVTFAGHRWSAESGDWERVDAADTTQVVAEVSGA